MSHKSYSTALRPALRSRVIITISVGRLHLVSVIRAVAWVPFQTSRLLGKWSMMVWRGAPVRTPQDDVMNSRSRKSRSSSAKASFLWAACPRGKCFKRPRHSEPPTRGANKFAQRRLRGLELHLTPAHNQQDAGKKCSDSKLTD